MTAPWWRADDYTEAEAVPLAFEYLAGPQGVALVKVWQDGLTDPGWGLVGTKGRDGFMPRYMRNEFNSRRVVYGYNKGKWAFAFVMRSVRIVCIDIDGKNGGLEHVKRLGMLPPTLAETSKSGDGYHLFYSVDEEWDDQRGYALLGDRIGLEQGVDIRATGCVYHHDTQRWNGRGIVPLPDHLFDLLRAREQKITAQNERISKILESQDDLEVLMMHDEMLADLAKPIPQGKRNNTLFAIGSQMQQAQVPDWDEKLIARAEQLGLTIDEAEKIVTNIERYA